MSQRWGRYIESRRGLEKRRNARECSTSTANSDKVGGGARVPKTGKQMSVVALVDSVA